MGLEGDRASKKALPARAQQTTIAEHLEAQVLPLNRALELIRDAAGGRFVISHKTRARERRNAAAEQLTLGLPQHLWDRLRAELAEETPDEALCTRLGQLLGATCARGRPILWGQWGTVTADNLVGRLHEGLTRAAAWDGMTADQPGDDRPPSRPAEEVLAEIYGQQPRAGPSGAEPLPLFDALKDPEENLGTDPAQ